MDLERFQKIVTLTLQGLTADTYKENDQGELIYNISSYGITYLNDSRNIYVDNFSKFEFEKFVLERLNRYYDVSASDITICDNVLSFCDKSDSENKQYNECCFSMLINNETLTFDELCELFPNFEK